MVVIHDISCGDLNLHWDWSPFGLIQIAPKFFQEASWGNCFVCMVNSPRPQTCPILFFCSAKGFHMGKLFLASPKTEALVQSVFEFKNKLHILLLPKNAQTIF